MRILRQPAGPFAVLLYREDALGNYLAVVYADPIGAPGASGFERWTLNDRYWYDPIWGSDVMAYRWSTDGKSLLVATSEIYGSGGVFKLNLIERRSMQLLPKKKKVSGSDPGPGYTLADIKSLQ